MNTKIIAALMVIILAIGIIGTASAAWPPNDPDYDNVYALIVGISRYQGDTFEEDAGARNGAAAFHYCVTDSYGVLNQNIKLVKDSQATWTTLNYYFDNLFADAGPNDLAIVYWAGHGGWTPDVEPLDEPDGLDGALVTYERWRYTDDEFAEKISAINAGTVIVILDSCHMGEFSRVLDMAGVNVLFSTGIDETTETYAYPFGSYLQKGYMPFSWHLKDVVDTNSNGVITVSEAFAYLYPRTVADAAENGVSQHPFMIDNIPGEVVLFDAYG